MFFFHIFLQYLKELILLLSSFEMTSHISLHWENSSKFHIIQGKADMTSAKLSVF